MAVNTDELDEELDDPISLIAFEDIKIETDQIPPAIIDLEESSDDESTYRSSYGKRDFVLPVTFFDISRNVRLLNECKPMSIKIVDCIQHPTYYSKSVREKDIINSDGSFLEVGRNGACDSEYKSNNAEWSAMNGSKIKEKAVHIQNSERKRGDSFYEKLKRRKEQRKQIALNSKNIGQVDFKRNKGLVGLKITGTIFKQIVDSEKALIKTKNNSGENNSQGKSESNIEKSFNSTQNNSTEDTYKGTTKSVFELIKTKSNLSESNSQKSESDLEKSFNTTQNNSIEEKYKGTIKSIFEKPLIRSSKSVENKPREKSESDVGNLLIRTKSNPPEDKDKEKCESNSSMKEIGATLDCLGTSVIPIVKTNNHVTKNININVDKEHTSAKTHAGIPNVKDKQKNIENSRIRHSLKILREKSTVKFKKAKCDHRIWTDATTNRIVEQKPKQSTAKDDKKVPKLSLKRSNSDTDNFYVTSEKAKLQCKRVKNTHAGKSGEKVDKAIINKDTNITRNQEGSNSPVIPCTTLNVSRASIPPNVYAKRSSISNPIFIYPKALEVIKYKFPNNNPLFTRNDFKSNSPVQSTANVIEKRLSDQNVSNTNTTKAANVIKTQIKPSSSKNTPIVTNQTINGSIKNQNNQNLSKNPTASNRPQYSGNNAIIFRKPPPSLQLQSNVLPNKGHPIQTVVNNRPQCQTMAMGVRPISCQAASYPPSNNNILICAQPRSVNQNFFSHYRMPSAMTLRANAMGLNKLNSQSFGYACPTSYRFPTIPPPPPGPPSQDCHKTNPGPPTVPRVSNDSIIGSTKNGEPIKKINIVAVHGSIVTDKEMMLAELNNAILPPELTINNSEDKLSNGFKRETDPRQSKPCPLSKKKNNSDSNNVKIPEKPAPKVGYSPPILPILTYRETLEILSQNSKHTKNAVSIRDAHYHTSKLNTKYSELNIKKLDNRTQKRKILNDADSGKQDKAKKISFADYKKRVNQDDMIDKIRNKSKNPVDDYNQDQGYDSDSTVKL